MKGHPVLQHFYISEYCDNTREWQSRPSSWPSRPKSWQQLEQRRGQSTRFVNVTCTIFFTWICIYLTYINKIVLITFLFKHLLFIWPTMQFLGTYSTQYTIHAYIHAQYNICLLGCFGRYRGEEVLQSHSSRSPEADGGHNLFNIIIFYWMSTVQHPNQS